MEEIKEEIDDEDAHCLNFHYQADINASTEQMHLVKLIHFSPTHNFLSKIALTDDSSRLSTSPNHNPDL